MFWLPPSSCLLFLALSVFTDIAVGAGKKENEARPFIVDSSLHVSYIRAIKPVPHKDIFMKRVPNDEAAGAKAAKKRQFGFSSNAFVFATFRVRFDRPMHVRRWNGTFYDHALPLETPAPGFRTTDSDHRHGLASIASLSCDRGQEVFHSYTVDRTPEMVQNNVVSNQLASLPSYGSDALEFAEDAFVHEREAGEKTDPTRSTDKYSVSWRPDEYVGTILLYQEQPSGPGGFSSSSARSNITRNVMDGITSFEGAAWRAALKKRLSSCVLSFSSLKGASSTYWPAGELVDHNGISLKTRTVSRWLSLTDRTKDTGAPWVNMVSLDDSVAKTEWEDPLQSTDFQEALMHYPSVMKSWHRMVPPMPNYCGLKNGELELLQVEALQAHHESVLISTHEHERSMAKKENVIPDGPNIIQLSVKTLIPPLLIWFFKFFTARMAPRLSEQMGHRISADTPRDVTKMLEPPLAFNISNVAVEAITASLTRSVSHSIVQDLGPHIAQDLVKTLRDGVYDMVAPFLKQAIPEKVNNVVPYLLGRSLPIYLSEQLTRTITHSLVPTLTLALTQSDDQHVWCTACLEKGAYCNYCHSSPQGMYYNTYYSAYYSDYYSDFYTKYYTDALEKIDKHQHQASAQVASRHENLGK